MGRMTDSRRANHAAKELLAAFDTYRRLTSKVTARARRRFEDRDWHGMHHDSVERLALYRELVGQAVARLGQVLEDRLKDRLMWAMIKAVYSLLIEERRDWEIAESFFNSVTRRVFSHVGLDATIEFVDTDFENPPSNPVAPVYRSFNPAPLPDLFYTILSKLPFRVRWVDRAGDARRVAERVRAKLAEVGASHIVKLEVAGPVFYRDRRAFVVTRLICEPELSLPVVAALCHGDDGIYVDAVLSEEDDVSILFSFARSYFHADIDRPFHMVAFLRRLMPKKRVAELYISIGLNKHGKTELYRDILERLRTTDERFVIAPGTRGMVMVAFVLPSHDLIFKVIKERFPAPKATTREHIEAAYRLVFEHDRGGRLVDAQAFEHLELDRDRFEPELLEELIEQAGDTVSVEGDRVVLAHVYVERRLTPLNVFLAHESTEARRAAILDYGRAIEDLARTNIFPGDMLLKNFGVTRHGRVVFYDYDELGLLTDYRFRRIPTPRTPEQEMASEPWYPVAENDIFPEEFRTFLNVPPDLREEFVRQHGQIYDAEWWQGIQRRLASGELLDVAPYGEPCRLMR